MGTLENGEKILNVCFERGGVPTTANAEVKVTVPAELLNAEGTQLPLDVETDSENVSFTRDFTNEGTPAMLVWLVPAE